MGSTLSDKLLGSLYDLEYTTVTERHFRKVMISAIKALAAKYESFEVRSSLMTDNNGQSLVLTGTGVPRLVAYVEDTKEAIKAVRTIHAEVLRKDIDYGVIPGTGDKPCLLKPGAETLLMAFQLSLGELQVDIIDLQAPVPGHREYRVIAPIIHRPTGAVVGSGVGSCSTLERKYRYRKTERKCPVCGKQAIMKSKPEFGGGWYCWKKKEGCGATFDENDQKIVGQETGQTENPDPADQYNTVLKMAKKRALIDGALTSCAASGVFTQDVEEWTESDRYEDPEPAPEPTPTPTPTPAPAPKKEPGKKKMAKTDRKAADVAKGNDGNLTDVELAHILFHQRRASGDPDWESAYNKVIAGIRPYFAKEGIDSNDIHDAPAKLWKSWLAAYEKCKTNARWGGAPEFTIGDAKDWLDTRIQGGDEDELGETLDDDDNPLGA